MSLSQTLTETIDEVIQTFITKVSSKYNLNNDELKNLWKGDYVNSTALSPVEKKTPAEIDYNVLLRCNKAELIALCKTHGHKCSGTKSILMNRLLGKEVNTSPKPNGKSKKTKVDKKESVKSTSVVQKLTANIPNILIRRNQFDNYEHPETGLIFDNANKIVIGKQNDDGTVDPLNDELIDMCNAFKFKFEIPPDLDAKSTLLDVKVDELTEEEEEEEELEVELEEELEEEEFLEEDDLIGEEEEEEEYDE